MKTKYFSFLPTTLYALSVNFLLIDLKIMGFFVVMTDLIFRDAPNMLEDVHL